MCGWRRGNQKTDGCGGCGFVFFCWICFGGVGSGKVVDVFEEIFWVIAHGILQNLRLENSHSHILWLIWIHRFDQFKVMLTWIVTVVSSYHGESPTLTLGCHMSKPLKPGPELTRWRWKRGVEIRAEAGWCFQASFFLRGGEIVVFFFEWVQTGRARRLTMCWWLQLKKRLVFQTANLFPTWDWNSTPLNGRGLCQFVNSSLRNSENYEAKLVSEDRLEFNDGDVWLKAPKVASAPRKRKVVEDRGEANSRFV